MKFKNIADGTTGLISALQNQVKLDSSWQVVGLGELGQQVAQQVATEFQLPAVKIEITREKDELGYLAEPIISLPVNLGKQLLLCDVGVETGKTALEVATKLAQQDDDLLTCFAAIVIPVEVQPALKMSFGQVIAARSPLIRRDLRWEFEEFD